MDNKVNIRRKHIDCIKWRLERINTFTSNNRIDWDKIDDTTLLILYGKIDEIFETILKVSF